MLLAEYLQAGQEIRRHQYTGDYRQMLMTQSQSTCNKPVIRRHALTSLRPSSPHNVLVETDARLDSRISSLVKYPIIMAATVALPSNTGTRYRYRVVYFKLCGSVHAPKGQVAWDSMADHLFTAAQVIDLPANVDFNTYTPQACPESIAEHVSRWISDTETQLPPRQESKGDW